jgi:hypothetical protein
MTVSSTSSRTVQAGDGSNTLWQFAFKVQQPADLVVIYTDATGTDVTLTSSQYDATGFGSDGGGTVTYPKGGSGSPAIAPGTTITIYRNVAVTQPTSISNQGAMWPQVIEAALDRLTYISQAIGDAISRSLVISPTDGGVALATLPGAALRKNSLLGFDANGQPYAAQAFSSTSPASTWAVANLLTATSATGPRAALGAAGIADDNSFTGTNRFTTQAAADNSTKAATTAYVDRATVLRSYLAGLLTANNGSTPNSKIDVAAGVCADGTNAAMMTFAGGTLDCGTTGANGLDAGSLSASASYHLFVIGKSDGTTALLASTSAASPTLPGGYSLKRRIWSFKTDGSSHILAYLQDGDFCYEQPVTDYNSTSTRSLSLLTLSGVPTGIVVCPLLTLTLGVSGAGNANMQLAPGGNAAFSGIWAGSGTSPTTHGASSLIGPPTNTSGQINVGVTLSSGTISEGMISTKGWLDRRGRDS